MMTKIEELKRTYASIEKTAKSAYFDYLRFASISAQGDSEEMLRCSEWLRNYLQQGGMDVEVWEGEGQPIIFSSHLQAGSDRPTLLFYGHYDVQPVDPIEEWKTHPFTPTEIDGEVYARGAQDNKGQSFYTILAITQYLKVHGSLPVNVKILIEGEEEMGSTHLSKILNSHEEDVRSDYVLIVDSGMHDKNSPAINLGARGIVTMDVVFEGSKTDLHSGTHGGIAYNPLRACVEVLSKLYDEKTGEILVPGFYDEVIELSEEEKRGLDLDLDEKGYRQIFGIPPTGGERRFLPAERAGLRPTCEINGISGGYADKGFKTVIPAKTTAKLSCRLVPDQDPVKTAQKVADYLESLAPEGIRIRVEVHEGFGKGLRTSSASPIAEAFSQAYKEVYGKKTAKILQGGSIPITEALSRISGGEVLFVGLGLPEDQIHAPDERFSLDRIEKGFLSISRVLELISERSQS